MPIRLRHYGWVYAACLLFNRIVPPWLFRLRWFRIYEREVSSVAEAPAADGVRWATESDLARLTEISERIVSPPQPGGRFCVIERQGMLVGCLAHTTAPSVDTEIGCVIDTPQAAWLYHGVVSGDSRGQGLFEQMLQFTLQQCRAEDRTTACYAVTRLNRPSERASRMARVLGTAVCIRLFRLAVCLGWGTRVQINRRATLQLREQPVSITIVPHPE